MLPSSSPPSTAALGDWLLDSPDVVRSTIQRESAVQPGVLRLSDQWRLGGSDVIGTLLPPLAPHGIEVLLFELPDRPPFSSPRTYGGLPDQDLPWSLNLEQTRLLCGLVDAEPSGVVVVGRGRQPSLLGIESLAGCRAAAVAPGTGRELWTQTPLRDRLWLHQSRGPYAVPSMCLPFVPVDLARKPEETVMILMSLLKAASSDSRNADKDKSTDGRNGRPMRIAIGGILGHRESGDAAAILHALHQAVLAAKNPQQLPPPSSAQAYRAMEEHFRLQQRYGRSDLKLDECLFPAIAHAIAAHRWTDPSTAAPLGVSAPDRDPQRVPENMRSRCDEVARCFSTSHALGLRGSIRRVVRPAASDWTGHGAGKACEKVVNLLCEGMAQCCHDWFTAARQAGAESDAAPALLSRWLGESLQKSWSEADATMRAVWRRHASKPQLDELIAYRESKLAPPVDGGPQPWSGTVIVEMLKQLRAIGRS